MQNHFIPSNAEQEIVEFINNPTEKDTEKIYEELSKLCGIKYQSQIAHSSSKYCALSGEELKESPIQINNYSFSPKHIQQYYLRNGILDVSIGDLKFPYHNGFHEDFGFIELKWEILEAIYGNNLNKLLADSYNHFNKRFNQPVDQQIGRSGVIQEQITANGKQGQSEWAHHNKDQLDENQRKQIEYSQDGIENSQNIY